MAEITAALVKELREKTGAGMMDCKKALNEVGGDIEAGVDWLRKKGLAAAAKKAGRIAAEGLVGVTSSGNSGAVVEVNAETDFVARNETFQGFVKTVTGIALAQGGEVETIKKAAFGDGKTVEEQLTHMISTIGENMNLRRAARITVPNGVVASYVHNATVPGSLGKIGVLVALESTGDAGKLLALGKQIAMHVAAAAPQALSISEVDPASVARERDILREQARASGKAEEIIEKMVVGRLSKYYQDVVLLEQTYVIDGETKIAKVVEAAAKELGVPVKLAAFERFVLGEGIEREEKDFAAEVAAQLGK